MKRLNKAMQHMPSYTNLQDAKNNYSNYTNLGFSQMPSLFKAAQYVDGFLSIFTRLHLLSGISVLEVQRIMNIFQNPLQLPSVCCSCCLSPGTDGKLKRGRVRVTLQQENNQHSHVRTGFQYKQKDDVNPCKGMN